MCGFGWVCCVCGMCFWYEAARFYVRCIKISVGNLDLKLRRFVSGMTVEKRMNDVSGRNGGKINPSEKMYE